MHARGSCPGKKDPDDETEDTAPPPQRSPRGDMPLPLPVAEEVQNNEPGMSPLLGGRKGRLIVGRVCQEWSGCSLRARGVPQGSCTRSLSTFAAPRHGAGVATSCEARVAPASFWAHPLCQFDVILHGVAKHHDDQLVRTTSDPGGEGL